MDRVTNCHLNAFLYTHRLAQLSALIINFAVNIIYTQIHSWLKHREKVTMGCSGLNGTPIAHISLHQGSESISERGADCKGQWVETAAKQHLPDMPGPLHP